MYQDQDIPLDQSRYNLRWQYRLNKDSRSTPAQRIDIAVIDNGGCIVGGRRQAGRGGP